MFELKFQFVIYRKLLCIRKLPRQEQATALQRKGKFEGRYTAVSKLKFILNIPLPPQRELLSEAKLRELKR